LEISWKIKPVPKTGLGSGPKNPLGRTSNWDQWGARWFLKGKPRAKFFFENLFLGLGPLFWGEARPNGVWGYFVGKTLTFPKLCFGGGGFFGGGPPF